VQFHLLASQERIHRIAVALERDASGASYASAFTPQERFPELSRSLADNPALWAGVGSLVEVAG